jgi:general nucleoside transport system ATP-binding protein
LKKSGLGLVPEDRMTQGLWLEESCYKNFIIGFEEKFSKVGFLNDKSIREIAKDWAGKFDVRAHDLKQSVESLSGGNQQKLILAREILARPLKLLIAHHPTRGVDIGAIEFIHKSFIELRNQGAAILLISGDLDELMSLSDRMYVMYDGKTVSHFERSEFDKYSIGEAMTGAKRAASS